MDFCSLNGVTLNYRLAGPATGRPLVFVNSLGTDARIWDAVIERLPNHRILSYDKRGHGLSDVPPGPCSIDEHVADLAALATHAGFTRFALCGVSIGGMIGQRFAVLHPKRLAGLVLCDTAVKVGDMAFWNGRIAAVRAKGLASISDAVLERWFSPNFRAERPADYAGYRNMLERQPVEGYVASCEALREADLREGAKSIAIKTLVVAGEHDRSTPPELVRETANLLPDARFEIVAGAGHIPSIEQPETLAALINSYLREVGHD